MVSHWNINSRSSWTSCNYSVTIKYPSAPAISFCVAGAALTFFLEPPHRLSGCGEKIKDISSYTWSKNPNSFTLWGKPWLWSLGSRASPPAHACARSMLKSYALARARQAFSLRLPRIRRTVPFRASAAQLPPWPFTALLVCEALQHKNHRM